MLNKIHSNVKSMLVEAREIVNRNQSLLSKGLNVDSIDLMLDKTTIPHLSFKIKAGKSEMVHNDPKARAKTHLSTQPESLTSMSKKSSISEKNPDRLKVSLYTKELLSLLPVESQLLSTRFYGLYKKKNQTKTIETDLLPDIRSKKRGIRAPSDSLRQSTEQTESERTNRLKKKEILLRAKVEAQIRQTGMVQRARKKKIEIKDWLKQSQKRQNQKGQGQDTKLQPWSSLEIDLEEI